MPYKGTKRIKPPEYMKCPECGKRVQKQGIGGHLALEHGIKEKIVLKDGGDLVVSPKTERILQLREQVKEKDKDIKAVVVNIAQRMCGLDARKCTEGQVKYVCSLSPSEWLIISKEYRLSHLDLSIFLKQRGVV